MHRIGAIYCICRRNGPIIDPFETAHVALIHAARMHRVLYPTAVGRVQKTARNLSVLT